MVLGLGKELLPELQKRFGGSIREFTKPNSKRVFSCWNLNSNKGCFKFFRVILPHLKIKASQARRSLDLEPLYYDDNGRRLYTRRKPLPSEVLAKRRAIYEDVKELKHG